MQTEIRNAYFAGLIDGEGTIAIYPYKQNTLLRPVIKVDMCCEKTIKALHSYYGGYMGVKKVEALRNRQPQWRWEVTFNKAIEVCRQIRPYLLTKSDNADLMLAYKPARPRGRPRKST